MKKVNGNVDQLVTEKFGFNVNEVMYESVEDSAMRKIQKFINADSNNRIALYSMEVSQTEQLKRHAYHICQELIDNDKILRMSDLIPESFERKIKQTFSGHFFGFDKGAAISYGRYLTSYIKWAKQEPGFFADRNNHIRMHRFIMDKLENNSKAKFFVRTRKIARLWKSFEKLNKEFCEAIHFVEMNRVESDTEAKEEPKPKLRLASNNDNQSKKKEDAVSETDYAQQTNFGFIQ